MQSTRWRYFTYLLTSSLLLSLTVLLHTNSDKQPLSIRDSVTRFLPRFKLSNYKISKVKMYDCFSLITELRFVILKVFQYYLYIIPCCNSYIDFQLFILCLVYRNSCSDCFPNTDGEIPRPYTEYVAFLLNFVSFKSTGR